MDFEVFLKRYRNLSESVEALLNTDSSQNQGQRMQEFSELSDLSEVSDLVVDAQAPEVERPALVMQRLAPYFTAVLLLQRSALKGPPPHRWSLTQFCLKGEAFRLSTADFVDFSGVMPAMTSESVQKAPASRLLKAAGLEFLPLPADTTAFLLRPTNHSAFVLVSTLAPHWQEDHIRQAHRLINRAFNP